MKHKEKIIQLHSEGKTYSQIQELLGCSKGTISYHLGVGQKEKALSRQQNGRSTIKKYIQDYKQGKPCTDCKEDYPYWMMDFDHLENKSFGINNFKQVTADLEIVKKEIEKCEVVCANCHRNRTYLRSITSGNNTYTLDVSDFYK